MLQNGSAQPIDLSKCLAAPIYNPLAALDAAAINCSIGMKKFATDINDRSQIELFHKFGESWRLVSSFPHCSRLKDNIIERYYISNRISFSWSSKGRKLQVRQAETSSAVSTEPQRPKRPVPDAREERLGQVSLCRPPPHNRAAVLPHGRGHRRPFAPVLTGKGGLNSLRAGPPQQPNMVIALPLQKDSHDFI
jgi:hypothetical protein